MSLAVHHSSDRHDWQTPDEVLDVVRQCGAIGLDPCTAPENPTGADAWSTSRDDGLLTNWSKCIGYMGGLCYVNPPYGRQCAKWIAKAGAEAFWGCPIITLTAARPDTAWGQYLLEYADAVCFWRGRIRFRGAPNPAPFPSMFAAFNVTSFADVFSAHGCVVRRAA